MIFFFCHKVLCAIFVNWQSTDLEVLEFNSIWSFDLSLRRALLETSDHAHKPHAAQLGVAESK